MGILRMEGCLSLAGGGWSGWWLSTPGFGHSAPGSTVLCQEVRSVHFDFFLVMSSETGTLLGKDSMFHFEILLVLCIVCIVLRWCLFCH